MFTDEFKAEFKLIAEKSSYRLENDFDNKKVIVNLVFSETNVKTIAVFDNLFYALIFWSHLD